jgi:DNA (cytosine-5)-methyltransferase 1
VCAELAAAVQWWKPVKGARTKGITRPDGRRVGKYGAQYLYKCPNGRCQHAFVEPFVLPASAAIDWTDLGTRLGDRKKPLAPATMRRIRAGAQMFAEPTVVAHHGNTWERPGSDYVRAWPTSRAPLFARTGTPGDGLAVPPMVVPAGGTWNDDARPLDEPLRTRTTRATEGLAVPAYMVSVNHDDGPRAYPVDARPLSTRSTKIGDAVVTTEPYLVELRNHGAGGPVGAGPVSTLTAGGNIHALAVPGAFVTKHHGGLDYARIEHMNKGVGEPLALSTRGSAALTTAETDDMDLDEFLFRMLKPREHLNAQRFPADYRVTGNQSEQTMQAGNAVSSNVAHWLGLLAIAALEGRRNP